mgnify:CR=1 FL=1
MAYNYNKLRGRITEICGTQSKFAESMGLSERTISLKLTGQVGWKQSEIRKAIEVLTINQEDIPAYFFDLDV